MNAVLLEFLGFEIPCFMLSIYSDLFGKPDGGDGAVGHVVADGWQRRNAATTTPRKVGADVLGKTFKKAPKI